MEILLEMDLLNYIVHDIRVLLILRRNTRMPLVPWSSDDLKKNMRQFGVAHEM